MNLNAAADVAPPNQAETDGDEDYDDYDDDFDAYSDEDFEDQSGEEGDDPDQLKQQQAEERARQEADAQVEEVARQAAEEWARKEEEEERWKETEQLKQLEDEKEELRRREEEDCRQREEEERRRQAELAERQQREREEERRRQEDQAAAVAAAAAERERIRREQEAAAKADADRKKREQEKAAVAQAALRKKQAAAAKHAVQEAKKRQELEAAEQKQGEARRRQEEELQAKIQQAAKLAEEQPKREADAAQKEAEMVEKLEAADLACNAYRPVGAGFVKGQGGNPGGLGGWTLSTAHQIHRAIYGSQWEELVSRGKQYTRKHGSTKNQHTCSRDHEHKNKQNKPVASPVIKNEPVNSNSTGANAAICAPSGEVKTHAEPARRFQLPDYLMDTEPDDAVDPKKLKKFQNVYKRLADPDFYTGTSSWNHHRQMQAAAAKRVEETKRKHREERIQLGERKQEHTQPQKPGLHDGLLIAATDDSQFKYCEIKSLPVTTKPLLLLRRTNSNAEIDFADEFIEVEEVAKAAGPNTTIRSKFECNDVGFRSTYLNPQSHIDKHKVKRPATSLRQRNQHTQRRHTAHGFYPQKPTPATVRVPSATSVRTRAREAYVVAQRPATSGYVRSVDKPPAPADQSNQPDRQIGRRKAKPRRQTSSPRSTIWSWTELEDKVVLLTYEYWMKKYRNPLQTQLVQTDYCGYRSGRPRTAGTATTVSTCAENSSGGSNKSGASDKQLWVYVAASLHGDSHALGLAGTARQRTWQEVRSRWNQLQDGQQKQVDPQQLQRTNREHSKRNPKQGNTQHSTKSAALKQIRRGSNLERLYTGVSTPKVASPSLSLLRGTASYTAALSTIVRKDAEKRVTSTTANLTAGRCSSATRRPEVNTPEPTIKPVSQEQQHAQKSAMSNLTAGRCSSATRRPEVNTPEPTIKPVSQEQQHAQKSAMSNLTAGRCSSATRRPEVNTPEPTIKPVSQEQQHAQKSGRCSSATRRLEENKVAQLSPTPKLTTTKSRQTRRPVVSPKRKRNIPQKPSQNRAFSLSTKRKAATPKQPRNAAFYARSQTSKKSASTPARVRSQKTPKSSRNAAPAEDAEAAAWWNAFLNGEEDGPKRASHKQRKTKANSTSTSAQKPKINKAMLAEANNDASVIAQEKEPTESKQTSLLQQQLNEKNRQIEDQHMQEMHALQQQLEAKERQTAQKDREQHPVQLKYGRGCAHVYTVGQRIEANYQGEGAWYPGVIVAITADQQGEEHLYSVHFDDGDEESNVSAGRLQSVGTEEQSSESNSNMRSKQPVQIRSPEVGLTESKQTSLLQQQLNEKNRQIEDQHMQEMHALQQQLEAKERSSSHNITIGSGSADEEDEGSESYSYGSDFEDDFEEDSQ